MGSGTREARASTGAMRRGAYPSTPTRCSVALYAFHELVKVLGSV